jgi:hypothetical protein
VNQFFAVDGETLLASLLLGEADIANLFVAPEAREDKIPVLVYLFASFANVGGFHNFNFPLSREAGVWVLNLAFDPLRFRAFSMLGTVSVLNLSNSRSTLFPMRASSAIS